MPDFVPNFFLYLLIAAGVTYLIRMIPLVLIKRKIKNRFVRSFLYYVPYSVLSAMTFPGILYSTGHVLSAVAGTLVALLLSYKRKSLIVVASLAAVAVLTVELLFMFV